MMEPEEACAPVGSSYTQAERAAQAERDAFSKFLLKVKAAGDCTCGTVIACGQHQDA